MTEFEQRLDTLIMMLTDPNITINPSGFAKIKENLLASAKKELLHDAQGPYKNVIEHMSSNAYRVWKENLWHDAQGDGLPEIDREVIVLCDDGHGGCKVCFGHRPVESYTVISITNHSEMEEYYPERYGKGEWNIPNVKWWLDVELPNKEEQQ